MSSKLETPSQPSGRLTLRLLSRNDAQSVLQYKVRNREYHKPFEPAREDEYFTIETQLRQLALAEEGAAEDRAYHYGTGASRGYAE